MAITRYATEEDLITWGLSDRALRDIEPATIDAALEAASRTVDGYIRSQYSLPLETVGADMKQMATWIAAYVLMGSVGYRPSEKDDLFKERDAIARKWLSDVGAGRIQPSNLTGAAGSETVGGQAVAARPMIISSSSRGFTNRTDPDFSGGGFTGD